MASKSTHDSTAAEGSLTDIQLDSLKAERLQTGLPGQNNADEQRQQRHGAAYHVGHHHKEVVDGLCRPQHPQRLLPSQLPMMT